MFEFVSVTSAGVAEDAWEKELAPTERGDFVVVLEMTDTRAFMHLRRGMDAEDVALGLRKLADVILGEDVGE
ncbi:MAG: hypothetical protein GVY29_05160 [Spirochaetes bacterium]|jgi:hypothetical protein|nr:hypothetical protein [Spirochaetota bacterium]